MSDESMKVLLVKPGEYAREAEIGSSLEDMQQAVGGWIEEYMPFDDDVALVCNEEGKLHGLDLNRAIYSDDGQIMDIIAGDFFVCYAPIESENFLSLPEDLMSKYEKKFRKNALMLLQFNPDSLVLLSLPEVEKRFHHWYGQSTML